MDMIEDYLRFLIQKTTDSMASKFGLSPGVLAMSDLVLYISQPGTNLLKKDFDEARYIADLRRYDQSRKQQTSL